MESFKLFCIPLLIVAFLPSDSKTTADLKTPFLLDDVSFIATILSIFFFPPISVFSIH